MAIELEELEKRVDQLVEANATCGFLYNYVDIIARETGYSVPFVDYILKSVDIHYSERKLFRHMVDFVASKVKEIDKMTPFAENLSANDFSFLSSLCSELKNDSAFSIRSVGDTNFGRIATEFPLLTRFAIVATYCASYNPQVTDRRFFFAGKDVLKRKSRFGGSIGRGALREDKWHESGPRTFDHQRAMFIFLYFCKEFDETLMLKDDAGDDSFEAQQFSLDTNCTNVVDFTSQVIYLVELGLLQVLSALENLDLPKYRSLCSLSFAEQIARSISPGFKLKTFLADFASEL